jgi:Leucine-rich repeat (LRR) protein
VDDAEVVIHAIFVSPDERVKMRRRMVIMGIVAILVIIGVAVGVRKAPQAARDGCGDDIFECCKYYNSTGNVLTSMEESYYNELQSLLFNEGTISEMYGVDSCEPQNQCMVWLANYEQRGITGEEAQMTLSDRPELLVQDYILCMMYLTLGGEEWDRNYEWLRDTDACNWYGLSCSLLSRIAIIDLASNGLNGSLPLELGLMPFLEEVNLSHNPGVIGTIPSELTQASGLRTLDLSNTRMNGTIPAEIERLEILDNLNLGNSSFSGTVPASLSRLERIRILYLDQNQFSGTLHRDFGNLTNIERLNINGNNFGGSIPEEFSSWQFLQHIDLSRNDFTGTFPLFLGDLRYLVTIGLYDTQIGGTIPESFCGSTSSRNQVIILNCSQGIIPSCSCCDDLVLCVEDDLPEDFT